VSRDKISQKNRTKVRERAQGRCEYCQILLEYSHDPFHMEHIIPLVKKGLSILLNLAFSCGGCNNYKSTRTEWIDPQYGETVRLFHPRKDIWKEHFCWSEDTTLVIGITEVGRATIEALKMNREGLVNLRGLLNLVNKHPPSDTI